jgi:iron complex transport system ATP-binding protein
MRFGYPESAPLFTGLDLDVRAGELLAIVGPNGAGKSTLLRLLVGILTPTQGEVALHGRPLSDWLGRERARRIALLPQDPLAPPDMTVAEVVRLGRHPYMGLRIFESPDDLAVVDQALSATQTLEFANRPMSTLSGGEAQRVHLAAALAQQPAVLALDEPTSSLDLAHQLRIFRLLRDLTRTASLAAVVVTHDVNLAGRFADRLCVLHRGAVAAVGTPADTMRAPLLAEVYGVRFSIVDVAGASAPLLIAHEVGPIAGDKP